VASEVAERVLEEERFDMIYACGPEEMTYRMFLLSERHRIPIQVSLERLMRCAIGLCGSCLIGRFRVCRDGPVFSNDQLREVREEFGHLRRGKTGQKLAL
nr:dihydroorotate dehydrogenase electron transfer subunit [Desulfobacterales bacterium]